MTAPANATFSPPESKADAGLLIVHGVGPHAPRAMLQRVVGPTLSRLRYEDQLRGVTAIQVGDPETAGGIFEGLLVRYAYGPRPIPRTGRPAPDERRLLILEGRWNDVFLKEGQDRLSAWVGLHATRMLWEVARYHAQNNPLLGLFSALTALALLLAIYVAGRNTGLALGLLAAGLLTGGLVVWLNDDVKDVWNKRTPEPSKGPEQPADKRSREERIAIFGSLFSYVVFHIQRGLVILVVVPACVLAPVAAAVLRLLASMPLLSGLANGLFKGIEAALLLGAPADMQAVVANHTTAANIRTRVRAALVALEQRVEPGGTITIVAHSGGAPTAWRVLSEQEIYERQPARPYRYRLITAGAALNWALRGFGSAAMPLDDPLVNHDRAEDKRTWWLNVYGTWDYIPHGPVDPRRLWDPEKPSWNAWEGGENLAARNLGAPVPDEHGEYWFNQEEFVPALVRAIDDQVTWAARDAGTDRHLLANCRLSLLGALVRMRLAILALPVVTLIAWRLSDALHNDLVAGLCKNGSAEPDTCPKAAGGLATVVARVSDLLKLTGSNPAVKVYEFVVDHRDLVGALLVVVMGLIAYALMDLYTNFCWEKLGRGDRPVGDVIRRGCRAGMKPPRVAVPKGTALLVWLPTVLALPAVLWLFGVGGWVLGIVSLVNVAVACLEIFWLNACLRAFCYPATLRTVMESRIGRKAQGPAVTTPASPSPAPSRPAPAPP